MPSIGNMTTGLIIETNTFHPVYILFIIMGIMLGFILMIMCGTNCLIPLCKKRSYDTESIVSFDSNLSDFYERDYSDSEIVEEKPIKKNRKYIIEGMIHLDLECDSTEMCAICIEDYRIGDSIIKLKCGHSYHDRCIQPWFNELILNGKEIVCPLCKSIQKEIYMKKDEYYNSKLQKIVSKE